MCINPHRIKGLGFYQASRQGAKTKVLIFPPPLTELTTTTASAISDTS
jgi:hypothetical protein